MKTMQKLSSVKCFLVLFSFLMIGVQSLYALQTSLDAEPQDIEIVEKPAKAPSFEGGMHGILTAVAKVVKYPDVYKKYQVSGRVISSFLILKDGTVADVDIKTVARVQYDSDLLGKDLAAGVIDEKTKKQIESGECFASEIKKIIAKLPKWTPAEDKGTKVNAYSMLVPISFAPKK